MKDYLAELLSKFDKKITLSDIQSLPGANTNAPAQAPGANTKAPAKPAKSKAAQVKKQGRKK